MGRFLIRVRELRARLFFAAEASAKGLRFYFFLMSWEHT